MAMLLVGAKRQGLHWNDCGGCELLLRSWRRVGVGGWLEMCGRTSGEALAVMIKNLLTRATNYTSYNPLSSHILDLLLTTLILTPSFSHVKETKNVLPILDE